MQFTVTPDHSEHWLDGLISRLVTTDLFTFFIIRKTLCFSIPIIDGDQAIFF